MHTDHSRFAMKLAVCFAAAAALLGCVTAALAISAPVLADSNLYADQDIMETNSAGSQFCPVDYTPDGLPSLEEVRFYGISRLRARRPLCHLKTKTKEAKAVGRWRARRFIYCGHTLFKRVRLCRAAPIIQHITRVIRSHGPPCRTFGPCA